MRLLAVALVGLLALIQYPLWLGKGGWLRVWELDRQLEAQAAGNGRLSERNASLEGEVGDLREGLQAVEERARYELGMVRADEVFIQISKPSAQRIPPLPPDSAQVRVARAGATTAAAPAQVR